MELAKKKGKKKTSAASRVFRAASLSLTLLIHAFYAVSWVNRTLRLDSFLHGTSNTMKNQKLQLGAKLSRRTRRRRSLKHQKLLQGVSKWLGMDCTGMANKKNYMCISSCMVYIFPLPLLGNVEPRLWVCWFSNVFCNVGSCIFFYDAWIIYGTWCHVVMNKKKLHHLQKPLRPPTSGYAPQQKPRKQTSKRSWWDSGTPDLLKKWQTFWKFGCPFFLAEKRFAQGY